MERKKIMDHEAVLMKVHRMAWQVYENNIEATTILIAGIKGCGESLSQLLCAELKKITEMEVVLVTIVLDKQEPSLQQVSTSSDIHRHAVSPVVVVDDVLNSGRTLNYAIFPFLNAGFKRIQTAVLVNRNHHHYPIAADYAGISLATTLQEHIDVVYTDNEYAVYIE